MDKELYWKKLEEEANLVGTLTPKCRKDLAELLESPALKIALAQVLQAVRNLDSIRAIQLEGGLNEFFLRKGEIEGALFALEKIIDLAYEDN